MKRLYAVLLTFVFALSLGGLVLAADLPVVPSCYEGTVKNNTGELVQTGVVNVYIGGKLYAQDTIEKGVFSACFEGEQSVFGQTVIFKVAAGGTEYPAQSDPAEVKYEQGVYLSVNLSADVPAQATSGGGTGGGTGGIQQAPKKPEAAPEPGSFTGSLEISLSSPTGGAIIYYTTDGSDPKQSGTRQEYKEKFTIKTTTTVKAVACQNNLYSEEAVFKYQDSSAPIAQAVEFTDLQGHWAAGVIEKLVGQGIISGYEDKTFRPNKMINRAEFSAIIARALELETVDPGMEGCSPCIDARNNAKLAIFSDAADVPEWAKGSVAAVVYEGLLKGYIGTGGESTFQPAKQLTRAELAAIISRVLVQKLGDQKPPQASFADQKQIPAWASEAVNIVAEKGIVKGYPDGAYGPQKEVTRAEIAAMIARLLEAISVP
jgi:hypothetical protein